MKTCPDCGTVNNDTAKYCVRCGRALAAADSNGGNANSDAYVRNSNNNNANNNGGNYRNAGSRNDYNKNFNSNYVDNRGTGNGSAGKNGKLPAIILSAAALIVAAAVLWLLLSGPGVSPSREDRTGDGNVSSGVDVPAGLDVPTGADTPTESQEQTWTAAHTHQWGDWIETVSPTCEKDGVRTRTCVDDSSHREEQVIPALGHEWLAATYLNPEVCARCGKTNGEPASKTVAPTLDELEEMIAGGSYVTKSDKNVILRTPTASEYLSRPYRAEVYNGKKTGRIFLIPIPDNDIYNRNGNLSAVDIKVQGWVVAKYGPFTFFVSDDGKMGWNGDVYFHAVN